MTDITKETNAVDETTEDAQEIRGIKVKFEVSADESPILDRLVDTYLSSTRGKMVLLKESVCGGYALKESGYLDLVLAIAGREDYIEADSFGRSKIMTNCLREIISPPQQIAFVQPPAPIRSRSAAVRRAKAEEPKPELKAEEPKAEEPKDIKVEMNDLTGLGEMGA